MIGMLDDSDYYAPGLNDFGFLPLLFLFGGGAAAAATMSYLMKPDTEWTTGEYNYWMDYISGTWKVWDGIGWDTGCWTKNPRLRQEWKNFGERFAKQNALGRMQIGGFSHDIYLPDQYELSARNLLGEMRAWQPRLNAICKAALPATPNTPNAPPLFGPPVAPDKPPPVMPPPSPDAPTSFSDMLKYGAWAVGGVLALTVFNTLRTSLRQPPTG